MRYVQLRAFHYVAICGGFSRAADQLLLTQPAISDQVRKLEQEYDLLLFNRHKKQVTLTKAGTRLLEITQRLFDTEQQAQELLSESLALRSGRLRIVADAAHHLLHILGHFRTKYPHIQLEVIAGNTEAVTSSLYAYESDIGILGEIPTSRDFEVIRLHSTPIIAFVSTSHPLAGADKITLQELSEQPLVMRERGSKTRAKLVDMAQSQGFDLQPSIQAEGREAVREIVASGAGVGFVSAAEFGQDTRLVAIPIDGPEMLMDEAVICLKERADGRLLRAFMTLAEEQVAAEAASNALSSG